MQLQLQKKIKDRFMCILFEQDHNYYNTPYCNEINTDLLIKIAMG